jgi:TolA-binding protein
MRDHHIVHAAKGVTHIWSAAIVTGFALVMTGAIALTAAQASTDAKLSVSQTGVKQDLGREIRQLNAKLDAMNATVRELSRTCAPTAVSE